MQEEAQNALSGARRWQPSRLPVALGAAEAMATHQFQPGAAVWAQSAGAYVSAKVASHEGGQVAVLIGESEQQQTLP